MKATEKEWRRERGGGRERDRCTERERSARVALEDDTDRLEHVRVLEAQDRNAVCVRAHETQYIPFPS